jgi:hypothetical protein
VGGSVLSIIPLLGIGCDPVMDKGDKKQFLKWLGDGVQRGILSFSAKRWTC